MTFAKSEAVGKMGTGLSHYLDVDAVPAFKRLAAFVAMCSWCSTAAGGRSCFRCHGCHPQIDRALEKLRAE